MTQKHDETPDHDATSKKHTGDHAVKQHHNNHSDDTHSEKKPAKQSKPASTGLELPSIESLFKASIERVKSRFLTFFICFLVLYGVSIAIGVIFALVIVLHVIVYVATQSVMLLITTGVLFGIFFISAMVYFSLWAQLALTYSLISPEKMTVGKIFKAMRPLVVPYIIYSFLVFIFFVGLFPISIPTLFIILILWAFWSIFGVFVLIEQQQKGLDNLWISMAIINQKFWGVLGRYIVMFIGVLFVSGVVFGLLALIAGEASELIANIVSPVLNLFITPFFIAYAYEIYKSLPTPKEITPPKIWIVLSILGGLLLVALMVFGMVNALTFIPEFIESFQSSAPAVRSMSI